MKQPIIPPVAKQVDTVLTYHGKQYNDPYYWLRQRDNEDVIAYLTAENEYTNAVLKDTELLQQTLFEEIKGRIQQTDESVPVFEDGYYYYTRTEEGKQYQIHCRKKGSLTADEEILLDENLLAEQEAYFSLGEFSVSPNNNLLAYSVDVEGDEAFTIFILDLTTGKLKEFAVTDTYYGLEWSNDNQSIFYTKFDEAHRPYQLWQHQIDTAQEHDKIVFEELDPSYFLEVSKSKDNKYLYVGLNSQITSEIWLSEASSSPIFKVVEPRTEGVEYEIDHYKGELFILTNADGATNFQLFKAPVNTPSKENWQPVFPYNETHYLQGVEVFDEHIVIAERVDGMQRIRVFDADFNNEHIIQFDDPAYAVSIGDNPEFTTHLLRLHYRSLVTPNTVYDFDLVQHELIERKRQQIPSGYNKSDYTSERLMATAKDGRQIPISLVYKTDLKRDEGNPLYLYAYGSYGVTVDPYFSVAQLSLLNRGFIFAIASIRGGSEKGRQWYEDGKFMHKKNTFTDFIDSANFLIDNGYTTSDLLVANGGSAGGLLMGAVANMAGTTFNTIIADVPFVDVINTMMDETIPLTVIEYDEWGNPNDEMYFEYMKSYSPYDNVEKKDYPNMLITAGLNDPRVQYWEPAKWVAKLRTHKTDDNVLLLKTNMDAGHAGASGRFDRIKETALEFAFILKMLGMEQSNYSSHSS